MRKQKNKLFNQRIKKEEIKNNQLSVSKEEDKEEVAKKEGALEKEEVFKEKKSRFRFLPFVFIFLSVILFNVYVARVGVTVGDSMKPTLTNGSLIYVDLRAEPERNDIIIFTYDYTYVIKRVIGLPGETIQIKNNQVYINGEVIDDVIDLEMFDYGLAEKEITLKEDEYFVMGDNRNNSYDSREIGPVSKDTILGVVPYSLTPFRALN